MKFFPKGLSQVTPFAAPVLRYATRHLVVLATLVLVATGAIGGSIFGLHTFAAGPCAAGNKTYYVVWGDTLSGIAYRYHSTVARLASYNHIANPNLIFPQQRICIPTGQAAPTAYSGGGGISVSSQNYYVQLARQDAISAGISPDIFVRQINEESGFQPYVVSWAGAIGIAQFMPATAASLGINPYNPEQSLWGAARLMASYVQQYGSYAMALAAYNAGPGAVYRASYSCGGYWEQCLPTETRNYIAIILGE
jgi:soluble lytic murein transglycosylase-like protein